MPAQVLNKFSPFLIFLFTHLFLTTTTLWGNEYLDGFFSSTLENQMFSKYKHFHPPLNYSKRFSPIVKNSLFQKVAAAQYQSHLMLFIFQIKDFLSNKERAQYFVKLHIIAGQLDLNGLNNTSIVYTLTGKPGEILSGEKVRYDC